MCRAYQMQSTDHKNIAPSQGNNLTLGPKGPWQADKGPFRMLSNRVSCSRGMRNAQALPPFECRVEPMAKIARPRVAMQRQFIWSFLTRSYQHAKVKPPENISHQTLSGTNVIAVLCFSPRKGTNSEDRSRHNPPVRESRYPSTVVAARHGQSCVVRINNSKDDDRRFTFRWRAISTTSSSETRASPCCMQSMPRPQD